MKKMNMNDFTTEEYVRLTTINEKRKLTFDFVGIKVSHNVYYLYLISGGEITNKHLILDFALIDNAKASGQIKLKCEFYYQDINGKFQTEDKTYVSPYIKVKGRLSYSTITEYKYARNFMSKLKKGR